MKDLNRVIRTKQSFGNKDSSMNKDLDEVSEIK